MTSRFFVICVVASMLAVAFATLESTEASVVSQIELTATYGDTCFAPTYEGKIVENEALLTALKKQMKRDGDDRKLCSEEVTEKAVDKRAFLKWLGEKDVDKFEAYKEDGGKKDIYQWAGKYEVAKWERETKDKLDKKVKAANKQLTAKPKYLKPAPTVKPKPKPTHAAIARRPTPTKRVFRQRLHELKVHPRNVKSGDYVRKVELHAVNRKTGGYYDKQPAVKVVNGKTGRPIQHPQLKEVDNPLQKKNNHKSR